jgi:hypothetical protein
MAWDGLGFLQDYLCVRFSGKAKEHGNDANELYSIMHVV